MTKFFDFDCGCGTDTNKEAKPEGVMILSSMDALKNNPPQTDD